MLVELVSTPFLVKLIYLYADMSNYSILVIKMLEAIFSVSVYIIFLCCQVYHSSEDVPLVLF